MANRDIWDEIELVSKGEHLDEEMFEYLSAYADGECTAKERRLVEAYLAESAEARAQLADLRMQAAIASEGMVDPPDWLRGAVLAKTVDRPRLQWPFAAAITTAMAGAAVLAAYWVMPTQPEPNQDLLANALIEQPGIEEPLMILPDEAIVPNPAAGATPVDEPVRTVARVERRSSGPAMTLTSHTPVPENSAQAGSTQAVAPPPPPEEEDSAEVTYAVVEYGGGRFEKKQPDVFDSEPASAEPSRGHAAATPAVLPDAREKLRDKVRKMNEEKLEIEGTEK